MLKIIAGEYRSRILVSPEDTDSRPYLNRVKESVFSILRGWFENARVLDLFAGVGTVGLEAVSRGAAQVVMVEKDPQYFKLLQKNIETLKCGDRATAVLGDALAMTTLARAPRPVDLVFIDPPYEMMEDPAKRERLLAQAARCREVMAVKSFLILRTPLRMDEANHHIEGMVGPEVHEYGKKMRVLIYAPDAKAQAKTQAEPI